MRARARARVSVRRSLDGDSWGEGALGSGLIVTWCRARAVKVRVRVRTNF